MNENELIASVPTKLWIAGRSVDARSGKTFPVHNPATGEPITEVADAGPEDAMAALDAAVAVQGEWAATPPRQRGEILRAVFEKLTERADDIALLMTLEMGKAIAESKSETIYGAEFFRWFSEEAVRIAGRYQTAPAGNGRILVHKQPVGPCLAITPWNFPLAMGTRKIGPALAAGCTMIVKPASETPLTMLLLAQLCGEAGLPEGVLSVMHITALGRGDRSRCSTIPGCASSPSPAPPRWDASWWSSSAKGLLRTSMELGGNAPFVVFDDADLDAAVEGAMLAKLRNGGEACTAANRLHVQNSVREEFTAKLIEKMSAMTLGPGTDPDTNLGPLINADQLNTVSELVDDAVAAGAQVRLGGKAPGGPGWFYPATVLSDVPEQARILREEVFGPVAPITGFDTEDEAIAIANDTEFGLVAYIYTENLDRALRVAEALQTGMVGVNRGVISDAAAPFGGVKASGFGREGGYEGIEEYLETKYIALKP